MTEYVGWICGQCDALAEVGVDRCQRCGASLHLGEKAKAGAQEQSRARDPSGAQEKSAAVLELARMPPQEDGMEQARTYVCKQCSSPVPAGHRFCGACGATVPDEHLKMRTDYFGPMQSPGRARLVLIRGDQGSEGLSYMLQGSDHFAGREDAQIVFPSDRWLNPRHANFVYRGDKLFVVDEGSLNGIYVRVRAPVPLDAGDQFICGEQVLRVERLDVEATPSDESQTYFYVSPRHPSAFCVVQLLQGGGLGMTVCAREQAVRIGREDSDMNFPTDIYMSGKHAKVEMGREGGLMLVDEGSKNGTFLRIRGERELVHGDYLFLGKQLLRVEITA